MRFPPGEIYRARDEESIAHMKATWLSRTERSRRLMFCIGFRFVAVQFGPLLVPLFLVVIG